MFKVPKLPGGSNKRKMPDNPSPEFLKKMRMDEPKVEPVKSRRVTVEEVSDEDDDPSNSFVPDGDYFAEEDSEGGRFFGGGLSTTQKDILNIFDQGDPAGLEEEVLSLAGVKRMLTRFERAVAENQGQRSKYPNEPSKFIDSEADLDSALKSLLPLSQSPMLAYPELIQSGTARLLIDLLSHENVDIVGDVVELIHELTDEDVGDEDQEDENDENEHALYALKLLVEDLLENSILELLVDNLKRFNEAEESDRQSVFHILGTFENVLGFNPALASQLVEKTNILAWLLTRIQVKAHDENRGYAAEVLSILLQDHQTNRLQFNKKDGVETILKALSQYRKRDPVDADEVEFMENVFDALCSALSEPEVKIQFLTSEGVDLMVLMMKEKLQARSRSIKCLDFAMSSTAGTATCEAFVEALGLKTLFSALMGKATKKQSITASEDTSHILGILSSLFTNIPSSSPSRIRLMTKFVEGNYEKVDKMLDLRDGASNRLKATDRAIEEERQAMIADGEEVGQDEEDTWYLRRLEGGMYTQQSVDYILAWICMEDDGIQTHLIQMLDRKSLSLKDIIGTLQVQYDNVDEEEPADDGMDVDGVERAPTQREILLGLISYLESV